MSRLEDHFTEDEIYQLAQELSRDEIETIGDIFDENEGDDEQVLNVVKSMKSRLSKAAEFKDQEIHELLLGYLKKFPQNTEAALKKLLGCVKGYGYGYKMKKMDPFPSLNRLPFFGNRQGDIEKKDSEDPNDNDPWPSLG